MQEVDGVFLRGRKPHADNTSPLLRLGDDALDAGAVDLADAREERPLIGMRHGVVIEKDAIATLPRSLLKRQGDQVAETALRKRVLVGEETVVRIQPDARPAFHRFGQEVAPSLRASPAGIACSKKSQMCPPWPERERSRAAARSRRRQVSRTSRASSSHSALSRSAARK